MKQLTVRGVPDDLAQALDKERKRRGTSLNQAVLDLLSQSLGLQSGPFDNGLAKFAGSWNEEELAAFNANTEAFGAIDSELWK